MSDGMLLGIDEGTTGVKAALFDQRLQPVAEARRDKVNRHPEEGWVEQDGEEVLALVVPERAVHEAELPGSLLHALGEVALVEREPQLAVLEHVVRARLVIASPRGIHDS